ncbi:MICOS complex subunit MIC27-like isoform X2 [Scyliorhinus canicula]|uniref:MICOS complex subunit MIC27-like isoform X2 n=1 Tax=Scyliorhinus canicula TaxID=7830 RepID=UPI0018F36905|nr:MICOS complex subunit MIC27-like isoform X2 [Scyliorhinus canicula]
MNRASCLSGAISAYVVKLSALPGGLGMVSFTVYASSKNSQDKDLIKPEQLSVYNEPSTNSKYVTEQPGWLLQRISGARQTVQPFAAQCKGAYNAIKNGAENTIAFGKGAYVFLKDPPEGFLPRVGVITVSGLAGLILAARGPQFKKVMYPAGLASVGMAICYPQEALSVAKFSGQKMYAVSQGTYMFARAFWKRNAARRERDREATKAQADQLIEAENTDTSLTKALPQELQSEVTFMPMEEKQMVVIDPTLMDHGQSNPEDTDMYSTRS